ncbi:MAG: MurR/RpiR family transcriptional regulator [Hyphomicrobiaceae bacterium]
MAGVLSRIEESFAAMTPTNQTLARYVLEHHRELAFAPVSRVAEAAGTSPATIIRFAEQLGLSGYAELQSIAQDALREEVDTVRQLETRSLTVDPQSLLGLALSADIRNLERAAASVPEASVTEAVEMLAGARTVHLIGLRSTHGLVQHFAFYLGWIGHSARIMSPGIGDLPEQLLAVSPDDVAIAFSFRRYTRETVEILAAAKAAGAATIAISDSPLSPLAQRADLALTIPVEFPAFFESRTAALSLINALVLGIALTRRRETLAALKRHEGAWSASGTYTNADFLRRFTADVAAFETRARNSQLGRLRVTGKAASGARRPKDVRNRKARTSKD